MTESLLETGRLADTSEPAKTVDPTQHPVAWVRSTFYGLAARTVVVRCPLCYRDHSHEWEYESGDQDPGERPAPCGRSEYVVRLRRAPRERMPTRWATHGVVCRRRTRIRIGIARARSRWCTADPPGHVDRAAQSEHARHTGT